MNELKTVNGNMDQDGAIIAQLSESEAGKRAIGNLFHKPIKNALAYQAIGRKVFATDPLAQGEVAFYERDPLTRAYVVGKRGGVALTPINIERFQVPTWTVSAAPMVSYSSIKSARFSVIDRAQHKAKDSIQRQEDAEAFSALFQATPTSHQVTVAGTIQPDNINLAMSLVEEHELVAAKIVVHPFSYKDIRLWGTDFFDPASQREIINTGLFGHLLTADVHVSTVVPKNCVFITAPAQFLGVMPIRYDLTIVPCDEPKQHRMGWVISEEIGIAVVNDYAVCRLVKS